LLKQEDYHVVELRDVNERSIQKTWLAGNFVA